MQRIGVLHYERFCYEKIGQTGWGEKEKPVCGPNDAICKPIALAPCTSDVHTVWAGAIGERCDMILGHEAVGQVVEVGSEVKDFKPGDKVLIAAITPGWNSLEAQGGYAMHSGGMLSGWKFSNFKDGVFGELFHVNDADGNLAHLLEGMDIAAACMLADMVPTGLHGVELADIKFGDTVAVIGIGPVGLMAVAGAAIRGGLMPGVRLRMEKLADLVMSGRIHPEKLITHKFVGLENVEPALMLMKDKPRDLIKPLIIIED